MNPTFLQTDLTRIYGELRILDETLAEPLGIRYVRATIAANRPKLEAHGEVYSRHTQACGRSIKTYYLNEHQALALCALSRSPAMARVHRDLVKLFAAARRGDTCALRNERPESAEKPVFVREHRRALPARRRSTESDTREELEHRLTEFFRAYEGEPEALASWAVENIFSLRGVLEEMAGIGH